MVGYARTATIRAAHPADRDAKEDLRVRLAYYRHMAEGPHPTITVIQDLDPSPGYGAWWGEVHTHLHRGLKSLGVVTNGSIRDLDQVAEGFQLLAGSVGPSHAFQASDIQRPDDNSFSVTFHQGYGVPDADFVLLYGLDDSDFGIEMLERIFGGGGGEH